MSGAAATASPAADGGLPRAVMRFVQRLRAAGLPVGTGQALDAVRAIDALGIGDRAHVYWTLHAVFVRSPDHRALFHQAFADFWRDPGDRREAFGCALPSAPATVAAVARRVQEAVAAPPAAAAGESRLATLTWSSAEALRRKDFAQMSVAEVAEARAVLRRLRLPSPVIRDRRHQPARAAAEVDPRATMRAAVRQGAAWPTLRYRRRRERPRPLVVLCDISGSMDGYARMLLHFLHSLMRDRAHVQVFLFATRLTNVTRQLRYRDIDEALSQVAGAAPDWSGGTRIGACLARFNREWSRRVLAAGAHVLLITDGLDCEAGEGLTRQMDRLTRSCPRLIWLNPLLRFAGFEARAAGVRAMLPFVDDFRPCHNLNSLTQLADVLSAAPRRAVGRRTGGRAGVR